MRSIIMSIYIVNAVLFYFFTLFVFKSIVSLGLVLFFTILFQKIFAKTSTSEKKNPKPSVQSTAQLYNQNHMIHTININSCWMPQQQQQFFFLSHKCKQIHLKLLHTLQKMPRYTAEQFKFERYEICVCFLFCFSFITQSKKFLGVSMTTTLSSSTTTTTTKNDDNTT